MLKIYQQTLSKSVTFSGIGLHTGLKTNIEVKPAKEDQVLKLMQELGELSDHICKDSHTMLIADDLGDMMVVMLNIMHRNNLTIEECLDKAYNSIKDRKGKMVDGIFVKEDSPGDPIPKQLGGKKN